MVVKKSRIRTEHERREGEGEGETKKKLWVQGVYCVHSKGVLASANCLRLRYGIKMSLVGNKVLFELKLCVQEMYEGMVKLGKFIPLIS